MDADGFRMEDVVCFLDGLAQLLLTSKDDVLVLHICGETVL